MKNVKNNFDATGWVTPDSLCVADFTLPLFGCDAEDTPSGHSLDRDGRTRLARTGCVKEGSQGECPLQIGEDSVRKPQWDVPPHTSLRQESHPSPFNSESKPRSLFGGLGDLLSGIDPMMLLPLLSGSNPMEVMVSVIGDKLGDKLGALAPFIPMLMNGGFDNMMGAFSSRKGAPKQSASPVSSDDSTGNKIFDINDYSIIND